MKEVLDTALARYNRVTFILDDPVSIPHRYTLKADIEIAGFLAALFAWGQRKTVLAKAEQVLQLMEDEPANFLKSSSPPEWNRFQTFVHRTFNGQDLIWLLQRLRMLYRHSEGLETCFSHPPKQAEFAVEQGLIRLHKHFFSPSEAPKRTRRHLASPEQGSACKRLNMFLRWMVRSDAEGIDFGLWKALKPAQLICPLDVHSARTARALGLLSRKQNDWRAALELTHNLRKLDPNDPIKYDVALFSLSHARFIQESFSSENHSH